MHSREASDDFMPWWPMALAALALASCNQVADPIKIIGSSTVFPFTTAVSAAFVEGKKGARPIVESTGTVAGFETFCSVQGGADIADASRRMTLAEFRKCQANRVGDLLEIPIGLDGIALVAADPAMTRRVASGRTLAMAEAGHSVHVEVQGLRPGREYWYRFNAGGHASQIGRTRTAPAPGARVEALKLAY
eukprot:gene2143-2884_t